MFFLSGYIFKNKLSFPRTDHHLQNDDASAAFGPG